MSIIAPAKLSFSAQGIVSAAESASDAQTYEQQFTAYVNLKGRCRELAQLCDIALARLTEPENAQANLK